MWKSRAATVQFCCSAMAWALPRVRPECISASPPRHRLHDAVEVLQRLVLQHNFSLAVAVVNRDPYAQRALQVFLRFADIWVHNSLFFGLRTGLNQVSNGL